MINYACLTGTVLFMVKFKTCTEARYATNYRYPLIGYEYVLIQRILARELKFPPQLWGKKTNHGIIVRFSEELFQIFETMSWKERVENKFPDYLKHSIRCHKKLTEVTTIKYNHNGCFPLYITA